MADSLTDSFLQLVHILDDLREKCPWDRRQTIQSLRQLTIEEMYELADAITENNWQGIQEELGDVMLHILFYAKIADEQNRFSLQDVLKGISAKLIARHPHVYGDVEVNGEEDVKRNWEKLKLKEGKPSVLSGVPRSMPALIKAMRLQEKAKQVGFEWENAPQVWEKVKEEMEELQEVVALNKKPEIEEEFGDLLFSMINYARFLNIDAENALELTNKKFITRFTRMEEIATANGKPFSELTLSEMDDLWNLVKR